MKERPGKQPEDKLSEMIRGIVPPEQLNSTRVRVEDGTIFLYNEQTEEVTEMPVPRKEKRDWDEGWNTRLGKRSTKVEEWELDMEQPWRKKS